MPYRCRPAPAPGSLGVPITLTRTNGGVQLDDRNSGSGSPECIHMTSNASKDVSVEVLLEWRSCWRDIAIARLGGQRARTYACRCDDRQYSAPARGVHHATLSDTPSPGKGLTRRLAVCSPVRSLDLQGARVDSRLVVLCVVVHTANCKLQRRVSGSY